MMNTTQDPTQDPKANNGSQAFNGFGFGYGVGLTLGILIIFLLIAYGASYMCKWMQHRTIAPNNNNDNNSSSSSALMRIPIDNSTTTITIQENGLDEAILFSYPKLNYSQLKSQSNAASACSICLADYKETELLRLLPDCKHIFHLKCIDAWMILHPTCPICRYSPLMPIPLIHHA